MKKKLFFTAILVFLSTGLFAYEGVFAGLGPEIIANSRKGVALGGNFLFGVEFNALLAAGIRAAYSNNMDTVSSVETGAFFRYQMPFLRGVSGASGPFVQAEMGSIIFYEYDRVFPAVSGGLSIGWRLSFPKESEQTHKWFIEPAVRAGYPYIWGVDIIAGIKFEKRN